VPAAAEKVEAGVAHLDSGGRMDWTVKKCFRNLLARASNIECLRDRLSITRIVRFLSLSLSCRRQHCRTVQMKTSTKYIHNSICRQRYTC